MAHYREGGGRENRKRVREDYEGAHMHRTIHVHLDHWCDIPVSLYFALTPKDAPTRHKRGRYYESGPQVSETAEQKLESLITRVGEKVKRTTTFISIPISHLTATYVVYETICHNIHVLEAIVPCAHCYPLRVVSRCRITWKHLRTFCKMKYHPVL